MLQIIALKKFATFMAIYIEERKRASLKNLVINFGSLDESLRVSRSIKFASARANRACEVEKLSRVYVSAPALRKSILFIW
jgi:hypothetical protein